MLAFTHLLDFFHPLSYQIRSNKKTQALRLCFFDAAHIRLLSNFRSNFHQIVKSGF